MPAAQPADTNDVMIETAGAAGSEPAPSGGTRREDPPDGGAAAADGGAAAADGGAAAADGGAADGGAADGGAATADGGAAAGRAAEPLPGPSGLPARDRPVRVTRRKAASRTVEGTRTAAGRRTHAMAPAEAVPPAAESEEELRAQREALVLARRIVDLASDKKAADIVLLEVRSLTTLTDYFVICSGGSERQLGSIADGIAEGLKAEDMQPIGREGGASAHWLLLDYGSVIVHIMAGPERDYYALEKLWSEAPLLLRVL